MDNQQKQRIVVATYMRKSKNWILEICEGNNKLIDIKYIHTSKFDFSGKRFKKNIEILAKNLENEGITLKEIENAILKEAKDYDIKPPKYLRWCYIKFKINKP